MKMSSTKLVTKFAKEAKSNILNNLCDHIDKARETNGKNRIPYGFVSGQIVAMKAICPWLTRDSIMNAYRKRVKKAPPVLLLENAPADSSSEIVDVPADAETALSIPADTSSEIVAVPADAETALSIIVQRGGRPKGTTNKRKYIAELSLYAAKNEIAVLFENEMKQCQTAKKRTKKGRLLEIINEVKMQK